MGRYQVAQCGWGGCRPSHRSMALSLASNLAWEGDGPLGRPVLLPALIQEASNKASPPAAPGAKICWAVEGAQGGAPA